MLDKFDYRRRSSSTALVHSKKSTPRFPTDFWSSSFLSCTLIESLCNVGLEAYIFYKFFSQLNLQNTTARTIPTYLALYIFAFIYQIWLAIVAVGKRNIIQVLGLVVFNLAFLLYSAFQIKESHNVIFGRNADATHDVFQDSSSLYRGAVGFQSNRENFWHEILPFLIAVPCVIGISQLFYIVACFKLYRIYGWDIYQTLGASLRVKNYFLSYQVFVVLLTYDWFFFGSFVVQLLILIVDTSDWTFWVTAAALPVTIIGLLAVGYAVRHELRWLMFTFYVCLLAALTYFSYELWRIYGSEYSTSYSNDRITLGIFAGVSIILLVMTFINCLVCQSYFGTTDLWQKARADADHGTQLTEIDQDFVYGHAHRADLDE